MEIAPFSRRQLGAFQGASLPLLLAEQATIQPDAAAIICSDREMTFRELAESSAHLADRLQAADVDVDDCVGLFVEPSLELVVGVWGVLTAGAAYLPLSPEYPDERLRYMIEDSRTGVIITQSHLVERVQELAPRTTRVIELSNGATPTGAASHVPPPPTSLAYVIYTSGSTGRPKGVLIEHRSILSQMRWLHECAGVGTGSRVLQKTPISFDAAQWEILAPAVGAQVVMGAPGIYRDVDTLIATIINKRVTTLQCVPTLLQALLDTEEFHNCTSLRYVFSGGEVLSSHLARAFFDVLPWVLLINLYGPTECTINATACLVDPATLDRNRSTVSIGAPVDNTQCFVLDEHLDPVDIGQSGELYIGGTQLARGYLNRPEQTKEKFLRSPFAPPERLYRTGDIVQWNPDGTLQFVGRTDNQVKLRGHRVELDEISTAIEEHNWVKRAAAVVRNNGTGGQQLVAFVELNPKEAALMDQGNHGSHHQSKVSRVQVKAQLSDAGLRKADPAGSRAEVLLPGKLETARQRQRAFARKSYRFYDGDKVSEARLLNLLARREPSSKRCNLESLTRTELGEILRSFGQFHSDERLLPKYAYASPGALYATQLYVEISGVESVEPGVHYYHPVHHSLTLVAAIEPDPAARLRVHFVGKQDAIEPVYRNNIQEVLELEAGHMVGLFEDILPDHGLRITPSTYQPAMLNRIRGGEADVYLGSFSIVPNDGHRWDPDMKVYVQVNPEGIVGMSSGQYEYRDGRLEHVSSELVQAKHVIAINQQVYARSSFGITLITVSDDDWLAYIALGAIPFN